MKIRKSETETFTKLFPPPPFFFQWNPKCLWSEVSFFLSDFFLISFLSVELPPPFTSYAFYSARVIFSFGQLIIIRWYISSHSSQRNSSEIMTSSVFFSFGFFAAVCSTLACGKSIEATMDTGVSHLESSQRLLSNYSDPANNFMSGEPLKKPLDYIYLHSYRIVS